jgi:hypothetical protein
MITEELKKYIELVEQQEAQGLLHEMANVGPARHGIENVYIHVGSVEKAPYWLRVKVSNVPGRYERSDSFVIKMPSLDYDPTQVANWITPRIMKKILSWIKLNQQVLYDYETGTITDTDVFLNSLSKI